MSPRTALFTLVLVAFLVLTGIATAQHGLIGIFAVAWRDTAGAQVFADLCIALFIATSWLKGDAQRRGLNPWPWLIATPFLGSISPLFYLVYRRVAGASPARRT